MVLRLSIRVAWVNLVPHLSIPQCSGAREQAVRLKDAGCGQPHRATTAMCMPEIAIPWEATALWQSFV